MVVRFDLNESVKDGDFITDNQHHHISEIQSSLTSPGRKPTGGFVSQRVEMYESPIVNENSSTYRNTNNNNKTIHKAYRQSYLNHNNQQNHNDQNWNRRQHDLQNETDATRQDSDCQLPVVDKEETDDEQVESRDGFESSIPIDDNSITSQSKLESSSNAVEISATRDYAGSSLIQCGVNYYTEGEYEKALKAFTTALKTQRVSVGDNDICIALTLGNLGSVYLQQDNIEEAENVLLESLELKRRLAPDMMVADTLNNLGNCANLKGDYDRSMAYYQEAIKDIRDKKLKENLTCNNSCVADEVNALFNIGRLEIQRRHWNEAMSSLNYACRMAREHYGTNHAFVAQTLDLIGFVQLSTSNMDSAMVSFTGALAIYRRIYGPMHLDVANSLFNVGMVREAKYDLADAWEAYTTSRDLFARLGTDIDHPGYATVRRSIGSVEKLIAKQNRQKLINKHHKVTKQSSTTATTPPAATTSNNSNISSTAAAASSSPKSFAL
jgi:tetratricopeptide (TPR) repeat protein